MKALIIEDKYLFERFSNLMKIDDVNIKLFESYFAYSGDDAEYADEIICYNIDDSIREHLMSRGQKVRYLRMDSSIDEDKNGDIDIRWGFNKTIEAIKRDVAEKESRVSRSDEAKVNFLENTNKSNIKNYFYRFSDEAIKEKFIYLQNNNYTDDGRTLIIDIDQEFSAVMREYFVTSGIFLMRAINGKKLDFEKLALSNSNKVLYLRLFSNMKDEVFLTYEIVNDLIDKSSKFGVSNVIYIVTSRSSGVYGIFGRVLGEYKSFDSLNSIGEVSFGYER